MFGQERFFTLYYPEGEVRERCYVVRELTHKSGKKETLVYIIRTGKMEYLNITEKAK